MEFPGINKGKREHLGEIKRLTIGKSQNAPGTGPDKQNQKQYQTDSQEFREEAKRAMITPPDQVLPTQKSYSVPKELKQKTTSNSSLDKLKQITQNNAAANPMPNEKPFVLNEKKLSPTPYGKSAVEMKEQNNPPTKIIRAKSESKTQNEPTFEWLNRNEIEEPKENDFAQQKKENTPKSETERTIIDELFTLLEKFGAIDTNEASTQLKADSATIEQIAKMFEEDGVLEIEYPASLTKKPIIKLKNPVPSRLSKIPAGKELQTYDITVDFVPTKVHIILSPQEARPTYAIEMAQIGKYTKRFLDFIKDEVAETMPIDIEEILDTKKSKMLKERFFYELSAHLEKYFPSSTLATRNMLSGVLLHEMYGLGDIELLLGDDLLEEVGINSSKTAITVYHRIHGWLKTNLLPGTEDEINNLASQIGRKVGRDITVLNPILDAHLLSGDRVNATLFPISSEGNTITIRRFARKPWTIIDFIGSAHTMSSEMAAMLWLAMQYELNVIIAGGTASGKTSTLNTILALVPTYNRIISIEDVREIVFPRYLEWNWIPMITRSPNPEGLGEVTMLDLMITSLRMRPDRIIVGEMRRKKEAEVLMEAIETGHSIYSTIHANSGYQVLRRLAEPPMSIPLMQIELIDLIVVQYRDRKTNKRRTFEIAEVEQTATGQGLQINTIYKWVPRNDSWERLNKPNKLITLLNLHTGMTEEDIEKEIAQRQGILEWMQRQGINDLDTIGFIVKLFYSNPEEVKKMAQKNISHQSIEEMMKEA